MIKNKVVPFSHGVYVHWLLQSTAVPAIHQDSLHLSRFSPSGFWNSILKIILSMKTFKSRLKTFFVWSDLFPLIRPLLAHPKLRPYLTLYFRNMICGIWRMIRLTLQVASHLTNQVQRTALKAQLPAIVSRDRRTSHSRFVRRRLCKSSLADNCRLVIFPAMQALSWCDKNETFCTHNNHAVLLSRCCLKHWL